MFQQLPGLHLHYTAPVAEHVAEEHHHGTASHFHSDAASQTTGAAWSGPDEDPVVIDPSWLTPERPKMNTMSVVARPFALLSMPERSYVRRVAGAPMRARPIWRIALDPQSSSRLTPA